MIGRSWSFFFCEAIDFIWKIIVFIAKPLLCFSRQGAGACTPTKARARPTPGSVSRSFLSASLQLLLQCPHQGSQLLVLSLQPRLLLSCELAASKVPWEAAPGQIPESPFHIAHSKVHCLLVPQPSSSVCAERPVHPAHSHSRRQQLLYVPGSQRPSCFLFFLYFP